MSTEDGIYNRLSNYSGLTALVSTRIHPEPAPQNITDPFVTYQRISTERISNLGSDTGMVVSRFQMSAWSQTKDTSVSVAEQVRAAFQRYSGTNSSVVFNDAYISNETENYDPETEYHQVAIDFEIWHRE